MPKVVLSASYIKGYQVLLSFSDQSWRVIDFEDFLVKNSHPQYDKYRNTVQFRKFKIENGNLVWGKDWDLIFPVEQLYSGQLK